METVDKLVQHTYNKIFFENLHFLKTDLESIKRLILSNQKLLSNKLDKVLFISDLAEKLKSEKIDEIAKQRQTYGQVLMNNYKEIEVLYNWLEAFTNEEQIEKTSIIWIKEEAELIRLSNYLFENSFIENQNNFYDVIINPNASKINWLKTKTLLIYLFERTKELGYITKEFSENAFIENSFLLNGKMIENVKQSKDGKNKNKNSKPNNHILIDTFFDTI